MNATDGQEEENGEVEEQKEQRQTKTDMVV